MACSSAGGNYECPAPCSSPPSLTVDYWLNDATNGTETVKTETLADGSSTYNFTYNFVNGVNTETQVTNPLGKVAAST